MQLQSPVLTKYSIISRMHMYTHAYGNLKGENRPSCDPPDQCTRTLTLGNLDVLYPEPDVGFEFFERPLKYLELSPHKRIVGYGRWRGGKV